MAYGIHIVLPGGPLTLEQWQQAINLTHGVLLSDQMDLMVKNPATGEVISRPRQPGDAEMILQDGTWVPAFRLFEGRVTTKPAPDFRDPTCQQRRVLWDLASQLGAQVVGDEGETYD